MCDGVVLRDIFVGHLGGTTRMREQAMRLIRKGMIAASGSSDENGAQ